MKVVNEALLAEFRGIVCEACRIRVSDHAHHVFGKGCGGGGRLDIRCNILGVCAYDHWRIHNGDIKRPTLLKLISRREKLPVETILDRIYLLRRLPKNAEMPSWGT